MSDLVLTPDILPIPALQSGFDFPTPLAEKYRPRKIADFVGLEAPKKIAANIARAPFASAWYFLGPSGTGKTTLAQAIVAEMPAELHYIGAGECTLDALQHACKACHFMPRMFDSWEPCKMHVILIDEADRMSTSAAMALLSRLPGEPGAPPNTIFILTANALPTMADEQEHGRLMSRLRLVKFTSYGMSAEVTELLETIWTRENGGESAPNFQRIVKESSNNVRDALMTLEVELMSR